MPLTPAQKSSAFRTRRANKLARYEAALREIADPSIIRDGLMQRQIAATALATPTTQEK